jgi:hypothetical protein
MRTLHLALLPLTLALMPLATWADGTGEPAKPHATLAPAPHTAEREPCTGEGEVGRVAAREGETTLARGGASARGIACDDVLRACDLVGTGSSGSAGLLLGDAFVQLGPDTRVELVQQPTPELRLERGSVRVIDERSEAAARVRVVTETLAASGGRGDLEVSALPGETRVCALDQPVVVEIADRAQTLPAGSCLASRGTGAASAAMPGAPSVAVADTDACPFEVAVLPGLATPPVGAAPLGVFPELPPFDPPGRDACDQPGSGCASVLSDIFDDPDPDPGCGFPGSPC